MFDEFQMDLEHLLKHTKAEAIEFHDDDLFSHPDVEKVFDVMKNTGLP